MKKQSAVIIGAGLSGLAAAAFLSKAGFQTKIFERTAYIGGDVGVFYMETRNLGNTHLM